LKHADPTLSSLTNQSEIKVSQFQVKTFAALCTLAIACAMSPAHAQDEQAIAKDYDVYVDLPTAFAFIKLPAGWKFIGKLDSSQLKNLPAETLTSLLPAEAAPVQLAAASQKQPARKRKG
jgi:hypothetical protein